MHCGFTLKVVLKKEDICVNASAMFVKCNQPLHMNELSYMYTRPLIGISSSGIYGVHQHIQQST